jgi:hypothetical protein
MSVIINTRLYKLELCLGVGRAECWESPSKVQAWALKCQTYNVEDSSLMGKGLLTDRSGTVAPLSPQSNLMLQVSSSHSVQTLNPYYPFSI